MRWGLVAALTLVAGSLAACSAHRSDADPQCMPPPRTSAVVWVEPDFGMRSVGHGVY